MRRLQELPGHALIELVLLTLEQAGMTNLRPVRRSGSPGGEAHFSAIHKTGGDSIPTAIVVRKDGREIGRERVTDLRGAACTGHYGPGEHRLAGFDDRPGPLGCTRSSGGAGSTSGRALRRHRALQAPRRDRGRDSSKTPLRDRHPGHGAARGASRLTPRCRPLLPASGCACPGGRDASPLSLRCARPRRFHVGEGRRAGAGVDASLRPRRSTTPRQPRTSRSPIDAVEPARRVEDARHQRRRRSRSRIVADARLLALDVTCPRSALQGGALRAARPRCARRTTDLERPLVLPPKRSVRRAVRAAPLLPRRNPARRARPGRHRHRDVSGERGRGTAASPGRRADRGRRSRGWGASKSIQSPPIALPDEPTPTPVRRRVDDPARRACGPRPEANTLSRSSRPGRSTPRRRPARSRSRSRSVNRGDSAPRSSFASAPRRSAFEAVGPRGAEHCAWPMPMSAPTPRGLQRRSPPHGRLATSSRSSCPRTSHRAYGPSSLRSAGLFVVARASLDTRTASGADVGLRTFDGQVIATSPTVVRLRREERLRRRNRSFAPSSERVPVTSRGPPCQRVCGSIRPSNAPFTRTPALTG